jgi:hypothetical protein
MKILTTLDYDQFQRIEGNRPINNTQVRKLYESIAEDPSIAMATPIIVNDKMEVLDGQHRLAAMKKLNLPVSYFEVESMGLEQVQRINSSTKSWTPVDYARSFMELGNENYKIYLQYKKKYHFSHQILLEYLSGISQNAKANTTPAFKRGKFKVGDLNVATRLCDQLLDMASVYPRATTRSFALAFKRAATSPKYKHNQMMEKMNLHADLLRDAVLIEDCMRRLEKIYNFHMGINNRTRLF